MLGASIKPSAGTSPASTQTPVGLWSPIETMVHFKVALSVSLLRYLWLKIMGWKKIRKKLILGQKGNFWHCILLAL